jgi:HPt (histidine-containing phosphotransfer) domain-containing protein
MQSESAGSIDRPTCNLAAALERLDGDDQLLLMLIAVFREDSGDLLGRLRAAVERRDAAEAERAAHSLKGLASNFDGAAAVEAALVIETASRRREWPAVTDGLPTLEREVAKLRQALDEHQPR